ncbi:hypothetical protein AKJ29_14065 [Aliiroseovarius crassostreae]|uniref:Uncharacterized protein n=1 Tax=Aliiroseovarius crassostreae TaxID=154981 RepID=A0A0P7IYB9_9RHOB|nr:hypothetical protein AKJ29_14065 [Aliiroseovarius crassostreae]
MIRPATDLPKGSAERAAMIEKIAETPHRFPTGKRKLITKQTLYNWVRDYEASGIHGLMRKTRTDNGAKRQKVTRAWDAFFEAHIDAAKHAEISDELTTYIRSLWAAGERGWRSITEKSTTRLIEMSRGLNVLAFDALELGWCGDTNAKGTQFGLCNVNRRQVEHHREYALRAIKDKDNAVFQDNYMPSIRRDYSSLLPRQIVVGEARNKIFYASSTSLPTGFDDPSEALTRECQLTLGLIWGAIDLTRNAGQKIPFIEQALQTANIAIAERKKK